MEVQLTYRDVHGSQLHTFSPVGACESGGCCRWAWGGHGEASDISEEETWELRPAGTRQWDGEGPADAGPRVGGLSEIQGGQRGAGSLGRSEL